MELTFGNNQGQSVQSSMDMQIAGNSAKMFLFSPVFTDHNLPIQAWLHPSFAGIDKIYLQLNIKRQKHSKRGTSQFAKQTKPTLESIDAEAWELVFRTNFGKDNKTFLDFWAEVAEVNFTEFVFKVWRRK